MALSFWQVSNHARDEWREVAHARQRIARTYPRSIVQPAPQGFGQPRSGSRRTALTAWRYGEHPEAVGEKGLIERPVQPLNGLGNARITAYEIDVVQGTTRP